MIKKETWKLIAIIFIVLFVLETSVIIWSFASVAKDDKMTYECYYDICEEYEDAYYDIYSQVCYCYESLEDTEAIKTEYMGK